MYIYKTTCSINGLIYVGERHRSSIGDEKYLGSGLKLKRAIKKYGTIHFSKEILHDNIDSKKELDSLEKLEIKAHRSQDRKIGYNIADGGEGGDLGEEVKAKRRLKNKGQKRPCMQGSKHPQWGIKHSPERLQANRISNLGIHEGSKNANSKLTEEEVIEIKEVLISQKGMGRILAEKYGVSISLISAIRQGRIWRHI